MKQGCTHILIIVALLASIPSVAQVSVKVASDRDKILIGEPVSVSVDAYVPLGSEISWFANDSIPHFLVTARSKVDTTENIDGKKISQTLTLTSFDSGQWSIPPFAVNVGGKPYYSDSLTIDVGFISFDPREDYHDIKDIIIVRQPLLKYIPWIVGGVALLSLALIWLLWNTNKKPFAPAVSKAVIQLTAYEDAMRALANLKKKGVSPSGEKAYYSEMNDILRKYVKGQFGVSTFERTNEELILQLSTLGLPQKPFDSLVQSLRMADFVKFARYRPEERDNLNNIEVVRSSIDLLHNYSGSAV